MSESDPAKDDMSCMDDTLTADVLYVENDQLKRDIKVLESRLHEYESSVDTAPMFFAMKIEERLDKLDDTINQILTRIPWERVE